jgi:hypothetical protein
MMLSLSDDLAFVLHRSLAKLLSTTSVPGVYTWTCKKHTVEKLNKLIASGKK